jgi:hypothetical protein
MLRPLGANFQLFFLRLAQAFGSRIRPDARLWFNFSLQPRSACSFLKWENSLSALSVSFDSLAPTRLTLRANLRLLYLKDPAFSIVVKLFLAHRQS